MDGLLLVDKPLDWTSFDVVNKVRSVLQKELREQGKLEPKQRLKVGHTGTLDPKATGLLVLAIGKTTKNIPKLIKLDKTYLTEATLGVVSSSGDQEGELTEKNVHNQPNQDEVLATVNKFVGEYMQTPPNFSAIKVDGKRAYDLARAGKEVKLEPRKVTIRSIEDINYEYPKLTFTASVGSGTYIRSLAVDIGEELGTGAYMSALRRLKVGDFDIKDAMKITKETTFDEIRSKIELWQT